MVKRTIKLKLKDEIQVRYKEELESSIKTELDFLQRVKKQKPAGVF